MTPIESVMGRDSRIFVAGHRGLVGSAIRRHLEQHGYHNLLLCDRKSLNLADARAVDEWFARNTPEYVIIAAAKVGGILANNSFPVEFLLENLKIEQALFESSFRHGVKRLLFLGSSAIYPKLCPQPIREEYLLTGELEPTNRSYAIAKIAGVEMCWAYNRQHGTAYLAAMPTNLYGPGDSFDPKNSHVLPGLIRRIHHAKAEERGSVEVWGTGTPRREFMYSADFADACVFLMNLPESEFRCLTASGAAPLINIGTGEDVTIRELAERIASQVGYAGTITFDASKPDGTPRKLLDVTRLRNLGWRHTLSLQEGLARTYNSYLEQGPSRPAD